MVPSLCFTASSPIRTESQNQVRSLRCSRHVPIICTVAPEGVSVKTRVEKKFRVVPPGTDASLLPPPPPRHHSLPAVGYFLEMALKMGGLPADKKDKYGPIFSSNYLLSEMTHVLDYDTIVEIMRTPEVFKNEGAIKGLEEMFPGNMLSMDGELHARNKAIFAPAFAKSLFSFYYPQIRKRTVSLWKKVHEASARGERVVLDRFFRRHYLGFIANLSTGLDLNDEEIERIRALFQTIQLGIVTYRFGSLGKPAYDAQAKLHRYLRTVVLDNLEEHRETIDELRKYGSERFGKRETAGVKDGSLNLLIILLATSTLSTEPGAAHDEREIDRLAYNVSGTFLAGYATTSTTSMSSIFELGFDSDLQERLRKEQESVIAAHNGVRDVTFEQVMGEMPLLDSFIVELIRVHPAGGSMIRIASKDVEIMGHLVRKGAVLSLDFIAAHSDGNNFPNPKKLVPDRYMRGKARPILSFGAPGSAHYCSGAMLAKIQLKCLISTLLRNYNFTLDECQRKDFRYIPEISPKSGVVVTSFNQRHT